MEIASNCFVTVRYVLRAGTEILDDGTEPLEYVHGYGTLVPGLEANLAGLKEGEKRTVELEAFEAFGERDEELVFTVEPDELPEGTNAGDELVIEGPDGGQFEVRVKSLGEHGAVLDANHPLAGLDVVFEVEVIAVRKATDEEIRKAAGALIQIGRNPRKPLE
jgi:FKBP-type peptidyl-prolyl cis-trans isomerase SlyD